MSVHQLSAFLREFASWWDQDCDASPVNMKDQSRQFREAADALDQFMRPLKDRNSDGTSIDWKATWIAEHWLREIAEAEKKSWHILALKANERADKAEADLSASQAALSELLEMYKIVMDAKDKAEANVMALRQEIERLKHRIRILEEERDPS